MTNDFVALLKDSSLVSVLTVVELTKQTQIFAANIGSWLVPAPCARRSTSRCRCRWPGPPAASSEVEGAHAMSGLVLEASGVALRRGSRDVLRGVDLQVGRGELVALMGLSGGGKTTFLRAVAGLDAFDAGTLTVDGVSLPAGRLPAPDVLKALRRKVGMVFQFHHLFEHMTAVHNVWLALVHVTACRGTRPNAAPWRCSIKWAVAARAMPCHASWSGGEAPARRDRPGPGRRPAAAADGRADGLARPARRDELGDTLERLTQSAARCWPRRTTTTSRATTRTGSS